MRVVFLGHQGWAFEHDGGVVLVDAIYEAMGQGNSRLPVWPQRRLRFDAMPPIAGMILTHEHSDHFDFETLLKVPHRGDIWIPDVSSPAMATLLGDLGFTVKRFGPLAPFTFANGITVTPLPTDYNRLERDVYALLVQSPTGRSFLTTVDAVPHPRIDEWLAEHCPSRTIDNFTNNYIQQLACLSNDAERSRMARGDVLKNVIEYVERFDPKRVLLSGQGWCHTGAHAFLNHCFFNVTNDFLLDVGQRLYPHIAWAAPRAGDAFDLERDGEPAAPAQYIEPGDSVGREYDPNASTAGTADPWCGRRTLEPAALEQTLRFVERDYGAVLAGHAPRLMEGLHEIAQHGQSEPKPQLFLRLRDGAAAHDYAFDVARSAFVRLERVANPARAYAVGLEMWASDLKLLLDADEEAYLIYESSVRRWNAFPDAITESVCIEAFGWFAPRFRVEEHLAAYRRRVAEIRARL